MVRREGVRLKERGVDDDDDFIFIVEIIYEKKIFPLPLEVVDQRGGVEET